MTALIELEYTDVAEVRGPLVVVRGASGVGWDELAQVRLDSGQTRHGLVLEVDGDLAVVQVLEGTDGMDPTRTSVAFAGTPLRIPVGSGWLGRVCNGRGEAVDGGPPVFGTATAPVGGAPLNPTLREPPAEPVLTGVSAIDALTTLVRGQKLPVFSVAGLPHLELATQIAAQASTAGGSGGPSSEAPTTTSAGEAQPSVGPPVGQEPFSVVFAAMGLTHAEAVAVRDALEERCGRIRGVAGSVTVLPVLTMPAGDITHPSPISPATSLRARSCSPPTHTRAASTRPWTRCGRPRG